MTYRVTSKKEVEILEEFNKDLHVRRWGEIGLIIKKQVKRALFRMNKIREYIAHIRKGHKSDIILNSEHKKYSRYQWRSRRALSCLCWIYNFYLACWDIARLSILR
jgi:hypothetical protein